MFINEINSYSLIPYKLNKALDLTDNLIYTYEMIQQHGISRPILDLIDPNNKLKINLESLTDTPNFDNNYQIAIEGFFATIGKAIQYIWDKFIEFINWIGRGIAKIFSFFFDSVQQSSNTTSMVNLQTKTKTLEQQIDTKIQKKQEKIKNNNSESTPNPDTETQLNLYIEIKHIVSKINLESFTIIQTSNSLTQIRNILEKFHRKFKNDKYNDQIEENIRSIQELINSIVECSKKEILDIKHIEHFFNDLEIEYNFIHELLSKIGREFQEMEDYTRDQIHGANRDLTFTSANDPTDMIGWKNITNIIKDCVNKHLSKTITYPISVEDLDNKTYSDQIFQNLNEKLKDKLKVNPNLTGSEIDKVCKILIGSKTKELFEKSKSLADYMTVFETNSKKLQDISLKMFTDSIKEDDPDKKKLVQIFKDSLTVTFKGLLNILTFTRKIDTFYFQNILKTTNHVFSYYKQSLNRTLNYINKIINM
jgi:hypothetical protein